MYTIYNTQVNYSTDCTDWSVLLFQHKLAYFTKSPRN